MNGTSIFDKGILQGLISLILVIAMIAGICLPGMDMKTAQPQDPLDTQEVLDITMLEVSENISSLTPIVVPTGGSAQPTEPQEEDENSEVSNTEQGESGEETEIDEGSGNGDKDGNEEGLQGAEGGDLLPDLAVVLTWTEGRSDQKSLSCQPNGTVSADVLNNRLSGGKLDYEVSLVGEAVGEAMIEQISWESDSGTGSLNQRGSLYLQGGTYRITVSVVAGGQRAPFHFELNHIKDVTLKMEYTLREDGRTVTREAICENTRSKTLEAIYTDQLTENMLEYAFSIVGVEGGVEITSVSCYQSGIVDSMNGLDPEGALPLRLDGGTTGENTFTVRARSESGTNYHFTISVPYKPRGAEILEIEIDGLFDGQVITTGSPVNFRVTAYRPEDGRNVNIPANGTDCGISVYFDAMPVEPTSINEYIVTPPNPEIGDAREFTLRVYAEDSYGNWGEKLLTLNGQRAQEGQIIGTAQIYVDLNVLGLGRIGPIPYDVLADEPVSYVTKKVLAGEDLGEIYGTARENLGWRVQYRDGVGFYLEHVYTGLHYDAIFYDSSRGWPEDLSEIDAQLEGYPELAALWRCLSRNGASAGTPDEDGSFGEMVYASTSGWIYTVNGKSPLLGTADYQLKDGDELVWYYTLAGGWEVEGCSGSNEGSAAGIGYCVHLSDGTWELDHNWSTEDGQTLCRSCGIVQDCLHENKAYINLQNGQHIEHCNDCGDDLGSAAYHTWKPTEGDLDNHTCEVCEATADHFWNPDLSVVIVEATCTEAGEVRKTCEKCGMEKTEYPTGSHEYGGEDTWEFDSSGHFKKCIQCGFEGEQIPFRFEWDEDEGDYLCKCEINCDIVHDWQIASIYGCTAEPDPSSTCQQQILNCSCGNRLIKTGEHSYESGSCTVCGAADPNHTHTWGDEYVITPVSCTEAGVNGHECTVCGESETWPAEDAHGHSWSEWQDISSASCTEDAKQERTCSLCGAYETNVIQEASGHSWSDWYEISGASCTEDGVQGHACSVCGTEETQVSQYAYGHSFADGYCSTCGESDPNYVEEDDSEEGGEEEYSMFAWFRRKWYSGNNREERI